MREVEHKPTGASVYTISSISSANPASGLGQYFPMPVQNPILDEYVTHVTRVFAKVTVQAAPTVLDDVIKTDIVPMLWPRAAVLEDPNGTTYIVLILTKQPMLAVAVMVAPTVVV